MGDHGWRLVHKRKGNRHETWVRGTNDPDAIVMITYSATDITFQLIDVWDGVPLYPGSSYSICGQMACQKMYGTRLPEVRAWFNAHLVYLGWSENAPNVYRRGNRQVRVEFRKHVGGITVKAHRCQIPRIGALPTPAPPRNTGVAAPQCD